MLFSGFIFGLLSSFHCIGMCGPIAMMLPVDHANPTKKALQILLYHLGKTTSYAILGLIFGMIGRGLFLAGFQQKLSIFMGIAIILFVIIPERKLANYNLSKPIFKVLSLLKGRLGHQFKQRTLRSIFTTGLLNGFLPCGLVYVALFGAIAMQNIGLSIVYMILFSLGTVPLMSILIYIKSFISVPVRNKIQKVIPYVVVCMGILFILRGLGLGIPYVSPTTTNLFVQGVAHCR